MRLCKNTDRFCDNYSLLGGSYIDLENIEFIYSIGRDLTHTASILYFTNFCPNHYDIFEESALFKLFLERKLRRGLTG